ncbi:hypothetical protein FJZ31_07015 [Candidatus Poribacteria bacterium]|nr:hypothetical protein [Candidatus Poribacteria bacterium]
MEKERLLSTEYREAIADIVEKILAEKAKQEPIDYIDWYRNTLPGRIIMIEENMVTKDDIAVIKNEIEVIKYRLQGMATKDDIKNMATKDDIENIVAKYNLENMATKDDIRNMATKDDIRNMATKDDIKNMATKDDIEFLKDSINSLKYWLSFAVAIIFFGLPFVIGLVMKLFGK